jgi:hypothetical protein
MIAFEGWCPVAEGLPSLLHSLEVLLEGLEGLFFVGCELPAAIFDGFEVVDLLLDALWVAGGELLVAPGLEIRLACASAV